MWNISFSSAKLVCRIQLRQQGQRERRQHRYQPRRLWIVRRPPSDVDPEIAVDVAVCTKLPILVTERVSGICILMWLVEGNDVLALGVEVGVGDGELTLLVKLT